jgi:predicted O-linked N-acetylglucosamine transferase (SPINDLY family)
MKGSPPSGNKPLPAAGLGPLLVEAAAHHTRGDFQAAERGYRAVLERAPDHFDALQLLGTVLAQTGRAEEAVALISRALAINPKVAEAHNNLGYALATLGRGSEAVESYRTALELKPGYTDALRNLAAALLGLHRAEEAVDCYRKVLAARPSAVAWEELGNACSTAGRKNEAVDAYRSAVAADPGHARSYNGLGNALLSLNRVGEALAAFDKAIALKEDYAEAHTNRGNTLRGLNRGKEANEAYRRAISLKPDHAEAHGNLGNLLLLAGHHHAAIASFEQALAIQPDYPYALGMVASCSAYLCEWQRRDELSRQLVDAVAEGKRATEPLVMISVTDDPAAQLACTRPYVRHRYPPAPVPLWSGERYRHDRMRVAYLSADFRDHPVAWLIAELIERHDRARLETFGISFGPGEPNAMRERLKAAFEHFVDVRERSDEEIAALLRESEIDIAVDLQGYTQHARTGVLARRCAPAQVSYLGFPATMGADYIDYILADRFVIPEASRAHYSEKVVYLPDTYQANDTKRRIAERTPTRAQARLPARGFVYCCFNNSYKITPGMFDVWMRLLQSVKGAVLWLVARDEATCSNLRRAARARGVAPERLVFAPRVSPEDYLARYRLADLFLDTLPFNAGTTASDALWAGLPVLTCAGRSFAGRMAGSLLNAIGLPELITHRLEDYEALAVELGNHPERARALKEKLAANRLSAPLFDIDRFRRHIEAAYRTMWEIAQRGEPPRSFAVEPPAANGSEERSVDLRSLLAEAAASHGRGEFEGAERGYRAVLARSPDHFDALQLLGTVLAQTGRAEKAVELIGRALAMKPKVAEVHNNLGYALNELRRTAEAVESYRRALALKPGYAEARRNLGAALVALGRGTEAIDCLRKAAEARPGAEIHNSLGNAYRIAGRHEEAAASFEAVLAADPARAYAPGMIAHSRDAICDWRGRGSRVQRVVDGVNAGRPVAMPMAVLSLTGDPETQRACAAIHARDLYPAITPLWRGERYRHDRIRVAYLSADFRDHPVAWLTAELFERHAREEFETWGVSFGHGSSTPMRKRLEAAFERFIDVRAKSDAEVAALLRESEVDIVVDLMGFTQFSRPSIVARRPAPVQVSYLGYPATMGVDYIDYIIADAFVIPPDEERHYAEKVARLPDTFQANDTRREIAKRVPTRAEAGLPERGFVYCCFNNSYKITPEMFDVWMRVLKAVDGSVLWLATGDSAARANLQREAQARGVAPGRLVLTPRVKQEDYLARYRLADLFLDTLPFNAGTTASDALWGGVPLLTCAGTCFAGRMAGSLLHAIGLPELVTHRLEDYEALAVELGRRPERVRAIREKLAANRLTAPLFDAERFRRHLEAAYRTMWEITQRGEPARSFSVESGASGSSLSSTTGTR